jgi:hypothetical protein
MPVLKSIEGSLVPTTTEHPGTAYEKVKVEIGKPLGIQMLTFFPGTNIKEWGDKAEIMITSQVRVGPRNEPAPRMVNMMLRNYNFKQPEPIRHYGGDVYGDRMLHYTKAYAGQRIGITMRGVEMDKVDQKTWDSIESVIGGIGKLALFTPTAPYLAAAGLAAKMAKTLIKAINRNDRLSIQRTEFIFKEEHQTLLESGRYLFWKGGVNSTKMKNDFRLTGKGDDTPNILVQKDDVNQPYTKSPYFILQIDSKKRKSYEDFEIGADSAALLEKWGDKDAGITILKGIQKIAFQINDAKQLTGVTDLWKDFKDSDTDEEKQNIRKKIDARLELLSDDNSEFISEILKNYLKP